MTLFEYSAVFGGIMVALSLENVASSFHKLFEAGGRVRWHWMAPTIAIQSAIAALGIFWANWATRNMPPPNPTFLTFLPGATTLFLQYLLTAAMLPDSVPESGVDLREFYFSSKRQIWSLFLAMALVSGATGVWSITRHRFEAHYVQFYLPLELGVVMLGALATSLIFVRAAWWHAFAIVVMTLGVFLLFGPMKL